MSEPRIEQENGTPESTVEVVPQSQSFWDGWKRRLLIVFCIHLIPNLLICFCVYCTHNPGPMFLLLVIDWPIGLLGFPIWIVAAWITDSIVGGYDKAPVVWNTMRVASFPVVLQFLGPINWFLVVSVLRTYARRSEKGRVSVILGVLSLFFTFFPYISLILGIVGLVYGIRFHGKIGVGLNVAGLMLSLLVLYVYALLPHQI